jgi:hypothetical protein
VASSDMFHLPPEQIEGLVSRMGLVKQENEIRLDSDHG